MLQTKDFEIRAALHKKKFKTFHKLHDTLVINELGVEHGAKRIDVAVLNGHLHGYEIKSSKDTLSRLPAQIDAFSRSFQKLSLIVAPNHVNKTLDIIPEWCGLSEVRKGARGGIVFQNIRRAKLNPEINFNSIAHFLWRNEVIDILSSFNINAKILRRPRKELYEALEENITLAELIKLIKRSFKAREKWTGLVRPETYGG